MFKDPEHMVYEERLEAGSADEKVQISDGSL